MLKKGRYPAEIDSIIVDEVGDATLIVRTRGRERTAFKVPLGSTMEEEKKEQIDAVLRHIQTKYAPNTAAAYVQQMTETYGMSYWTRFVKQNGQVNREAILDDIEGRKF